MKNQCDITISVGDNSYNPETFIFSDGEPPDVILGDFPMGLVGICNQKICNELLEIGGELTNNTIGPYMKLHEMIIYKSEFLNNKLFVFDNQELVRTYTFEKIK